MLFVDIFDYWYNLLINMFSWMPASMAIIFIFLFGVVCVFIYIKLIVAIIKCIPFF